MESVLKLPETTVQGPPKSITPETLNIEPATRMEIPFKPPAEMLDYISYPKVRAHVLDRVKTAMAQVKPVSNQNFSLAVVDVDYTGKEPTVIDEQRALREGRSLTRRLSGKYELTDLATGKKTYSGKRTLMNVPWMTKDGFYLIKGVPYGLGRQFRMDPGIYARTAADGATEAQFNVEQGTGIPFKTRMDPKTGVFVTRVAGHGIPLYHLLSTMGVDDNDMRKAWGSKLYEVNRVKKPHSSAVAWLRKALTLEKDKIAALTEKDPTAISDQTALRSYFSRMRLGEENTARLMGKAYANVTPEALIDASVKILRVASGEDEPGVRDNPSNQRVFDEGDHLATYLNLDRGGVFRSALWKLKNDPERLKKIPSGLFDQHVGHHLNDSGLAQVLEQINPMDAFTNAHKITRLGEGAIESIDSAPDEAREVQPGYFGVVDPVKGPECYAEDMEAMTRQGWKAWPDITDEDELACRIDGRLVFERPSRVMSYEYDGLMYGTQSNTLSYLVTPDHRMWVAPESSEMWRFETAEKMHGSNRRVDASFLPYVPDNPIATFTVPNGQQIVEQYKGKVYCAEVPGGLLFVRRGRTAGFWCGNSLRIGLDMYMARTAVKGPDQRLYARFKDTKTGDIVWKNSIQLEREFIGDPGATASKDRYIPAMSPKYGIQYLPKNKVRYELVSGDDLFTEGSSTIPLKSGVKGMRQMMGGKFMLHALPLEGGEAPLVQTPARDGTPSARFLGGFAGAVSSPADGVVTKVTKNGAVVRDASGKEHEETWYDWVPFARKTYLEQTPTVKVGDKVSKGDILAKSNYTDSKGRLATGRNLRTALMGYRGYNFEDAVVISESAAHKLTSNHMYTESFQPEEGTEASRKRFISLFPTAYAKEQLDGIDQTGIIKPGTTVRPGDPLMLVVRSYSPGKGTLGRNVNQDKSEVWDHDEPGVVRDVVKTKNGIRIFVESKHRMQVGDKLAGPHGNKGTVSIIVPDEEMPHDAEGRPLELLISPKGIPSRVNPALVAVAKLGKIAAKTGKPYVLDGFSPESLVEMASEQLKKHGIPDTETVVDPVSGKSIPEVGTGVLYVYKMQQEAEAKGHSREIGGYSLDEDPSRAPGMGAKHFGDMELGALMASGGTEVFSDMDTIQAQANPDFWRQLKLGGTPSLPRTPAVYDKFKALIRASGVRLDENTSQGDKVFAATDEDIRKLTGNNRITSGQTYDTKMNPIKGGLFDPEATGSNGKGDRFAYIELPEPVLNPLMEPVARYLLGLKKTELEDIMTGRTTVAGKRGGEALKHMLEQVKPKDMIKSAKDVMKNGTSATKRDEAAKRLMYANALADRDLTPDQFMMTRVPVLPPRFRKIVEQGDRLVVPDLNYLYKRLINASEDLKEADQLGPEAKADAREQLMHAYRALTGTEPPQDKDLQSKRVGGVLKQLLSKGSPKKGFTQRKVLGFNVDLSALGVVVPNPHLTMDQVGIPEDYAWNVFGPFVIRRMVQSGRGATEAARALKDRTEPAKRALHEEMKERPVVLNRAPTLHRYGIMAFNAVPVSGKAIQINPQIAGPYNADFDGNCLDFNERVILRISKKALKRMEKAVVRGEDLDVDLGLDMISTQLGLGDQAVVEVPIGNFPRYGSSVKDRNGADVYSVGEGVEALSYDISTGEPVYRKVTHFTVERDCHCVDVRYGARHVIVSSNESLAVFDHETGALRKESPAKAKGLFTPRTNTIPDSFGTYGDEDFGWWVGAFVSDGWVTKRTVGHSKLSEDIVNRFSKRMEAMFGDGFKRHDYAGGREEGHLGKSKKTHYNGTEVAAKVKAMGFYDESRYTDDSEARAARFKRIPPDMLANGSEKFLWGVVSGLLDGDSSLSVDVVTGKARYHVRFNTSSKWLKDGIVHLLLKLGIKCSVTETKARARSAKSWAIIPATHMLKRHIAKLNCADEATKMFLEMWDGSDDSPMGHYNDIVPVTYDEMAVISKLALADKDMTAYAAVRRHKNSPRLHRKVLLRVAARHPQKLEEAVRRAKKGVTWEAVSEVNDAGSRDVFDMAVEGTKVFAIAGGLIVFDTMSFTVPVSKAAVAEAYAKMLPSKNLLSRRAGDPHYSPSQEPHEGLYIMTKRPTSRPVKVFPNKAAMKEALDKGEISFDDPVQIGDG